MIYIHLLQILLFIIALHRSITHVTAIVMLNDIPSQSGIKSATNGIIWCTVFWSAYYMTFYLY